MHVSDARFLLPFPVERAAVIGPLDQWRAELETAGVELSGRPDVVIVRARDLDAAPADARAMVVVGGRRPPRWPHRTAVTPIPRTSDTGALVPIGARPLARLTTAQWAQPSTPVHHARNVVAALAMDAGLTVPGIVPLWVVSREAGPPWILALAAAAGLIDASRRAILVTGRPTSRSAFIVGAGDAAGGAVVKFARNPALRAPFDDDDRGLQAAAAAGPVVTAHAPRLLGRFEAGPHLASVESLLPGAELGSLLGRPARDRLIPRVEEVAAWIVAMARATAQPHETLEGERDRLRAVLEDPAAAAAAAVVPDPPPAPAVLRHGDLATWNILLGARSFGVVDWETAVPSGYPLWDLLHFLQDALASLEPRGGRLTREEHFVRLFRGELPTSPILFRWVRAAVDAVGLDPATVGSIATLLWADQAVTVTRALRQGVALDAAGGAASLHIRRLAQWTADPDLGPGWSAWR